MVRRRTERTEGPFPTRGYYLHQVAFWTLSLTSKAVLLPFEARLRVWALQATSGMMPGGRGSHMAKGCSWSWVTWQPSLGREWPSLSHVVCGSILHFNFCLYPNPMSFHVPGSRLKDTLGAGGHFSFFEVDLDILYRGTSDFYSVPLQRSISTLNPYNSLFHEFCALHFTVEKLKFREIKQLL